MAEISAKHEDGHVVASGGAKITVEAVTVSHILSHAGSHPKGEDQLGRVGVSCSMLRSLDPHRTGKLKTGALPGTSDNAVVGELPGRHVRDLGRRIGAEGGW